MPFTVTMPKLSPTMEEGAIAKWHKKVGDFVAADELLLEVSTDKATVEYNAIDEGYLRQILVQEGAEAKVNEPIAIFSATKDESIAAYKTDTPVTTPKTEAPISVVPQQTSVAPPPATPKTFVEHSPAPTPSPLLHPIPAPTRPSAASPLARKLASQQGIDLLDVKGSGPGGRIMKRDLAHASKNSSFAQQKSTPAIPSGTFEEEPLSQMRKVISQRLRDAKMNIPHFYTTIEVDAQPLWELREQLKSHKISASVNDLVVRAVALALREHPEVNSGFNAASNTIIRFKTVDISIAVSVDSGLITPIVKHADHKTVGQISEEVKKLAAKAKEGKLTPAEFQGGSFTISNLGMYGVSEFAAIINPPQAAILAVSSILEKPVIREGKVVPGMTMNLTLSSDHRVVDGVIAAVFLKTLRRYLEAPAILLI